ncbi:MAG: hypothetical protein IKX43_06405 [Paludibacteraceae bacterium]|nr:hypothetical protein [Paludibacteraceae bacterium]
MEKRKKSQQKKAQNARQFPANLSYTTINKGGEQKHVRLLYTFTTADDYSTTAATAAAAESTTAAAESTTAAAAESTTATAESTTATAESTTSAASAAAF